MKGLRASTSGPIAKACFPSARGRVRTAGVQAAKAGSGEVAAWQPSILHAWGIGGPMGLGAPDRKLSRSKDPGHRTAHLCCHGNSVCSSRLLRYLSPATPNPALPTGSQPYLPAWTRSQAPLQLPQRSCAVHCILREGPAPSSPLAR